MILTWMRFEYVWRRIAREMLADEHHERWGKTSIARRHVDMMRKP